MTNENKKDKEKSDSSKPRPKEVVMPTNKERLEHLDKMSQGDKKR